MLLIAERRGRIEPSKSDAMIERLGRLPITINDPTDRVLARRVLPLARTHKLTIYDASYLELAVRLEAKLASLDKQLNAAAKAVGVPTLDSM